MGTESGQERPKSHLFLVRLWVDQQIETDEAASQENSVHGKVQHVITGQAARFEDWAALAALLREMAQPQPGNTHNKEDAQSR